MTLGSVVDVLIETAVVVAVAGSSYDVVLDEADDVHVKLGVLLHRKLLLSLNLFYAIGAF